MEAGVLGPMRIGAPDGEIALSGLKERTVLAHLISRAGHVVPADEMVDALWPDGPPRTAGRTLQSYVARVRAALEKGGVGSDVLTTQDRGYRLAIDPEKIDAHQFARLVDLGRSAGADGQHRQAATALESALALWRGPAYSGFEGTVFGRAEGRRLTELRLAATEDLAGVRIASGSATQAIPELEAHVAQNPLRERGWALLVRGHAAADNQAAALDALERARRVLSEELGVDPGEELRDLQRRVLAQDPTLTARSPLPPELVAPPTPLIGGSEQLESLMQLWRTACTGPGSRVLLKGDPGSGRWRLACEFAGVVHAQGAFIATGAAGSIPLNRPVLRVVDARTGPGIDLPQPAPQELQLVVGSSALASLEPDAEVTTQPLSVPQVAQMMASYAPGVDREGELLRVAGEIHERTAGNAAAVRQHAVRWAREAISNRVAVHTAAASAATATTDEQLAVLSDDVHAWAQLNDDLSVDLDTCPWRGLASYAEEDSAWFAGRERLTAELVARLGAERALLLVGGSGSGKSSLLHAGLMAALATGALPGSSGWVRIVLRPGQHPMRTLTAASFAGAGNTGPDRVADLLSRSLEDRGGAERILLVIDQFEEAWTACTDPGEREAFLSTLAGLAADDSLPLALVLAVRADHAGSVATHAGVAELLAGRAVFIAPMVEGELRRAVEGPAARAGLVLDVGLTDALVADTMAEPGGLPLLSTALTELWEHRDGRRLTLASYAATGGVGAAIARMAERAYADLDAPHQRACRVLLLRLAGPGEGEGVVRRRVGLDELAALPDPTVLACVESLVAARLLTVTDGHVEVAHEALFRSWPRLREWLAEDATARDLQRRLTVGAADWEREGRDPSALWGGARLAAAVDLTSARPDQFTGIEAAFVEAGVARLDAERSETEERARAAQRQNGRLRRLLGGLGITLVLALLAGALALSQRNEAAAQRETATAQRLAATAVSEDYLAERMLTAVEAVRTEESPQTVGALLSVLAANPAVIDRIDTPYRLLGAAAGIGSTEAVAIANLQDIHVFNTVTGENRIIWSEPGANIQDLRVSPDGRYAALVVWPLSGNGPGRVMVLELASGDVAWQREIGPAWSPLMSGWDFTEVPGQLAVATTAGVDLIAVDGSAADRTIELEPIEPQRQMMKRAWPGQMLLFARPDAAARLLNLATGKVQEVPGVGERGAVSPDGRSVITQAPSRSALEAGPLLILDLADLESKPVEVPFTGDFSDAAFLPDGRTIVAGSLGGTVVVADSTTGEVDETLTGGHNGAIMGIVTSPDGGTAWTAGRDGDLIAWDLTGDRRLITARELPLAVTSGQVSADGTRASVWAAPTGGGVPSQTGILDLTSADLVAGPYAKSGEEGDLPNNLAAGITPDGSTLLRGASAGFDDPARMQVIDADSGAVRHDVELPWWPNGMATTTDGSAALVAGDGGVVRIDLSSGQVQAKRELPPLNSYPEVQSAVEPSPDGRHVAVARGPEILILDVTDLETVATWSAGEYEHVLAMQWLDGGSSLAFGGRLGRLEIRSFPEGRALIEPRQAFPGFLLDIARSPNGALLALLGTDGEVLLWDVASGQPIGEPLVAAQDAGWGWVRFTPDGRALEALYDVRRGYTFPIDPQTLIARACALAAREPTAAEWASMHGSEPQRPTCGEQAGRQET